MVELFKVIIEEVFERITLLGVILIFVVATLPFLYKMLNRLLNDPRSRTEIAKYLRAATQLKYKYKDALEWGLGAVGKVFGEKLWTFSAFGICVGISFLYSTLFFLSAWLMGSSGKIGNTVIMPSGISTDRRVIFLGVIIGTFLGTRYLADRYTRSVKGGQVARSVRIAFAATVAVGFLVFLGTLFVTMNPTESLTVALAAASVILIVATGSAAALKSRTWVRAKLKYDSRPLSIIITGLITFIAVGTAAFIAKGSVTDVIAGPLTLGLLAGSAGLVSVLRKNAVAGASAVTAVSLGCGVIAFILLSYIHIFSSPALITAVLFVTILPIFNGLWDWVSLNVSRYLGQRIVDHFGLRLALSHSLLDLGIAIGLLLLLVITLVAVLSGFNLWVATIQEIPPPINLNGLLEAAHKNPWPNSFWITLMLISTLIPTGLHFVLMLTAFLTVVTPSGLTDRLATEVDQENPSQLYKTATAAYLTTIVPVSLVVILLISTLILFLVRQLTEPVSDVLFSLAKTVITLF